MQTMLCQMLIPKFFGLANNYHQPPPPRAKKAGVRGKGKEQEIVALAYVQRLIMQNAGS